MPIPHTVAPSFGVHPASRAVPRRPLRHERRLRQHPARSGRGRAFGRNAMGRHPRAGAERRRPYRSDGLLRRVRYPRQARESRRGLRPKDPRRRGLVDDEPRRRRRSTQRHDHVGPAVDDRGVHPGDGARRAGAGPLSCSSSTRSPVNAMRACSGPSPSTWTRAIASSSPFRSRAAAAESSNARSRDWPSHASCSCMNREAQGSLWKAYQLRRYLEGVPGFRDEEIEALCAMLGYDVPGTAVTRTGRCRVVRALRRERRRSRARRRVGEPDGTWGQSDAVAARRRGAGSGPWSRPDVKDSRSASQILFGLLPEQTLDARGGVWKVRSWNTQSVHDVDVEELRRELARCAGPWEREGRDEGFVAALRQGRPVRVETLDRQDGVRVDPFPRTWRCKRCGRAPLRSAQTVRLRLRRPARSIAVRPVSRRLRRDPGALLSEVRSARPGSHGAAGNDQSRGDSAELPRL